MGANNQPSQLPKTDSSTLHKQNKTANPKQPQPQKQSSLIIQNKQQQQFTIPQSIQNRENVRDCINKYNEKIDQQMKKKYVQDFFNMREKLLKTMQGICKADYSMVKEAKQPVPSKQFKECMTSVQGLITEEDNRMQEEFGVKLFLLADKCLIKEERIQAKEKHKISPVQKCVDKLVKYRNLNMEMHILKLQLAREML